MSTTTYIYHCIRPALYFLEFLRTRSKIRLYAGKYIVVCVARPMQNCHQSGPGSNQQSMFAIGARQRDGVPCCATDLAKAGGGRDAAPSTRNGQYSTLEATQSGRCRIPVITTRAATCCVHAQVHGAASCAAPITVIRSPHDRNSLPGFMWI